MKGPLVVLSLVLAAGPAFALEAGESAVGDFLRKQLAENPVAAPALRVFAEARLIQESRNPVLVQEVRKQNRRKDAPETVSARDKEWIAGPDDAPFKKDLLSNAASQELRRIAQTLPAVREAFVMDDQGALVGSTGVTSDYWQGDEAKWQNSYNKGDGQAFVAPAEFDASANAVLQQISLPVLDAQGKTVGAITWGLVLDKINWEKK
jgi:hypothetical protein